MRTRTHNRRGFTLPELLVAVSIFVVILTGVAGLLVASIRAVDSGRAASKANEEARTALNLLERDLQTAFTSRDLGEYYSFYGTPIGMVFVGTVRSYNERSESQDNLARVTYVLHAQAGYGEFETEVATFVEEDGNQVARFDEATLRTFALVRYVERGVKDLDAFYLGERQRLADILEDYFGETPDFPDGDAPTGWAELREIPRINQELSDIEALRAEGWSEDVVSSLLEAKRRQLWIRMMSQPLLPEEPDQTDIDISEYFPSAWDLLQKDVTDYIVAANIEQRVDWAAFDAGGREWLAASDHEYFMTGDSRAEAFGFPVLFRYGITAQDHITLHPFWNAAGDLPLPVIGSGSTGSVELPNGGQLPLQDPSGPRFQYPPADPYGLPDPTNPEDYRLYETGAAANDEDVSRREEHAAWQNVMQTTGMQWSPLMQYLGTPMNPRLPEVVQITATLRYESPYPGAPDVSRAFELLADVPTGYMRNRPDLGVVAGN